MFKLITLATFVAMAAASCTPPNGGALHCEQCIDNPIVSVDTSSVAITPYPPTASIPIVLSFNYDNTANTNFDNLKADVVVAYYGKIGWGDCKWHTMPIPLNNLDGCKIANNCPLVPGNNPNKMTIDLSPFASIIDALAKDTYYSISVTVKSSEGTPLSCLKAEFLLS